MNSQFEGNIALVTGGCSGIGLATAKLFSQRGAMVYITGRGQEELDEAISEIGQSAVGIVADVADLNDIDKIFNTIREEKGKLNILFANAGIGELAPLGQITEAHFDKEFDLNVKGTVFTVQGALPLMAPGSAIVLNTLLFSIRGRPGFSIYGATKAALRSFAADWAVDVKGKGIRVNAISPSINKTAYHTSPGTKQQPNNDIHSVNSKILSGRTSTMDEIAQAIAFLASDESRHITGSELFVEGA